MTPHHTAAAVPSNHGSLVLYKSIKKHQLKAFIFDFVNLQVAKQKS